MGREENKLGEPSNCDASWNQGRRQTGSFGGNVLDHLQPKVGPARLSGSPPAKVMGRWNPCLPGLSLSWCLVSLQHSVVGWEHPAESAQPKLRVSMLGPLVNYAVADAGEVQSHATEGSLNHLGGVSLRFPQILTPAPPLQLKASLAALGACCPGEKHCPGSQKLEGRVTSLVCSEGVKEVETLGNRKISSVLMFVLGLHCWDWSFINGLLRICDLADKLLCLYLWLLLKLQKTKLFSEQLS